MQAKEHEKQLTRRDLLKVFWRSLRLLGSFSFERMQGLGFTFAMIPVIKKLYKTKEERASALKRHLEFFNTATQPATFVMGVTAAMEEENARNKNFDTSSITSLKVGLMGPLAAMGDSLFWGTIRLIAVGIGTSLTLQGNLLGLLFYILINNIPHYLMRYYGLFYGYKIGTSFLSKAMESGIMKKITFGTSIVGLMAVGAMIATTVKFTTPLEIGSGEGAVSIQEFLDSIFPSILPLLFTLLVLYLLKRHIKVTYIIFGVLIFGILASAIGIM